MSEDFGSMIFLLLRRTRLLLFPKGRLFSVVFFLNCRRRVVFVIVLEGETNKGQVFQRRPNPKGEKNEKMRERKEQMPINRGRRELRWFAQLEEYELQLPSMLLPHIKFSQSIRPPSVLSSRKFSIPLFPQFQAD
jgi:hypothetical protein